MHSRTLATGAIVATSLAALIGLDATAASAGSAPGGVTRSASIARTTASGSANGAVDSTGCDDVFLWTAPGGDTVGRLCITVNHDGTTINDAIITFTTTSECSGSVLLRVSGVDENSREFGFVDSASCGTGTATASFKPVSQVLPDTYVCGTLLDDRFTPAEACAVIS
jgi:hypothetical protein